MKCGVDYGNYVDFIKTIVIVMPWASDHKVLECF